MRFVRLAQAIDRAGLMPALRVQREQPLFPTWVWAVHGAMTNLSGEFHSAWALSVQLAAAIPLVLAVVPVYFLSMRLWGARAGALATLLFCLLPEVVRIGADGLSDGLHLFWFAVALWAVIEHLAAEDADANERAGARRLVWLLIAGVATAMAVLTRAEVLVLPAALVVTIAVLQLRPRWRRAWRPLAGTAAVYALGLGLVLVPYLATMNSLAPGPAVDRILGRYDAERYGPSLPSAESTGSAAVAWRLADGGPMSFARKDPSTSIRHRGYAAAVGRFAGELADAFGYWIGALALIGLGCTWRRPIRPIHLFVILFSGLFSILAIRFAASEGYLGARHLIVLVVAGIGAAGQGALFLWNELLYRSRPSTTPTRSASEVGKFFPRLRFGFVVVVLAAGYVVLVVGPLHTSRAPHRRAGEWLADEAPATGIVIDTRGWTGLYSGRPTRTYAESQTALLDPRLAYLVVEREELERDSRRSRTLRTLISVACRRAVEFAGPRPSEPLRQSVVVYRWDEKRFRRWAEENAILSAHPWCSADRCPTVGLPPGRLDYRKDHRVACQF